MIPISARQVGDIVMWHNTKKSKWYNKIVNKYSQKIPEDKWGYSHCGVIYHDIRKIIQATPPCAKICVLEPEKGIQMELWRCESLTVEQRAMIATNFQKIAFKPNGKPRKYDWTAMLTFAKYQNNNKLHCAEAVGVSIRDSGGNVFPKYMIKSVLEPNQIILSGYMKLIYREEVK